MNKIALKKILGLTVVCICSLFAAGSFFGSQQGFAQSENLTRGLKRAKFLLTGQVPTDADFSG